MNDTTTHPDATKPTKDKREHFPQLDILRAFAALGVICFHCLAHLYAKHLNMGQLPFRNHVRDFFVAGTTGYKVLYPLTFGWMGVPLFFVLSGFVIHYAYLKNADRFSPAQFCWRRFWRIYPAYFVALCAFIVFPTDGNAVFDPASGFINKRQILTHLFLIHNFSLGTFYYINGAFWSLANEMQFYALYPLVIWMRKRIGMANALWFTIALSVAVRLLLIAKGLYAGDRLHINWLWASTPVTWMDWMLGAYAAELLVAGKSFFARDRFPAVPLLVLILAMASTQIYGTDVVLSRSLAALFFVWVVEAVVRRPMAQTFLNVRVLVPLGYLSYSIYLWHQPILSYLTAAAVSHGIALPVSIAGVLALAAVMLMAVIPIAVLSYRLVEMPSQKIGNTLWRSVQNGRSSPAA